MPNDIKRGDVYIVRNNIDLKGSSLELPKDVTLNFKGGKISNGTVIGDNTAVVGNLKQIFDRVTIRGSWNVENISTNMFVSKSEDNFLRNVIALSNPNIPNTIKIEKGNYFISLKKEGETGLYVKDKSILIIDGMIYLRGSNIQRYNIIETNGKNVTICGMGSIVGDRKVHNGKNGEWGHGIMIWGANDVIIKDIEVNNCWGDCIYVGGNSSKIKISNCNLGYSRRQGVSVTSGKNISILDCVIHDIFGTDPQHGIDIEPNPSCSIDMITIKGCHIYNCHGGVMFLGNAKVARIGTVRLEKNVIKNIKYMYPVMCMMCSNVSIINNQVWTVGKYAIQIRDTEGVVAKDNVLYGHNRNLLNIYKCINSSCIQNIMHKTK